MKAALTAALLLASAAAQTRAPGNRPPSVKLTASPQKLTLESSCGEGVEPRPVCKGESPTVRLSAAATDPDGDALSYAYSADAGSVTGGGPDATLDLTGVAPGFYTVTVKADDGRGLTASATTRIELARCTCPAPLPPPPCPTVTVSCQDVRGKGQPLTFSAYVSGGDPSVTPTFNWTVSGGTLIGGQGTSSITAEAADALRHSVTAVVEVGGYERSCATSTSCTLVPGLAPTSRKVDEYGEVAVGDEKARLDNFAVELQNDPTAQGYLICYGGRRGPRGAAQRRCDRAKNFLVVSRGVDSRRLVALDGGYRAGLTVEAWIVPSGAVPPKPTPTVFPRGRERR